MSMREFEQYLKASDFFADTMNAHLVSTAEVVASFATVLKRRGQMADAEMNELLRRLGGSPACERCEYKSHILVSDELAHTLSCFQGASFQRPQEVYYQSMSSYWNAANDSGPKE